MPRKNDLLVWVNDWSGNKSLCRLKAEIDEETYDAPDLTRGNLSLWRSPEMWAESSGGAKKDFTFVLPKEYST
jgi:hypothetical protein|tara:strand:+ start:33197 stop:33415 length:219 start_codon:yes stop_codon:yes gene_type:complete